MMVRFMNEEAALRKINRQPFEERHPLLDWMLLAFCRTVAEGSFSPQSVCPTPRR
jgi:hypothetical protein